MVLLLAGRLRCHFKPHGNKLALLLASPTAFVFTHPLEDFSMRYLKRGAALLAALFAIVLLGAGVVYVIFTGPNDLYIYPAADASPYLLPWKGDDTRFCIQGNRAVVSHRGWEQYAFDFTMPVGTDILAARAGEVTQVVVEHDGNGRGWPNNRITLRHEDGTLGHYLHIKKDGNIVNVGDKVNQGQVLCASGNVGNSALPHLHFHVTDAEQSRTLPISFVDVKEDQGVPRMFSYYTSGNTGAK
jgi:murein DD-endopeptidase MepM/ murein hydrolase activator NlpD